MVRHKSRVTVFIDMRLFPSPLARSSTQSRIADHRVWSGRSAALVAVTLLALVIGVPASGAQPRTDAFTLGSEPWTDSDCAGEVAVVAASDSRAQPDLYGAVTLAAALGTNCVILAGHRDESMPAAQRERLTASIGTVYVVGGTAAVPNSKLAGRTAERVSGTDRWLTAAAVGMRAAGLPETTEPADDNRPDWPQRIELSGTGDAVKHVTLRPGRWHINVSLKDNRDDYGALAATIEISAPDGVPCWRPFVDQIIPGSVATGIYMTIAADVDTHERTVCRAGRFALKIDTGGPLRNIGSWAVTFTER